MKVVGAANTVLPVETKYKPWYFEAMGELISDRRSAKPRHEQNKSIKLGAENNNNSAVEFISHPEK